MKPYDIDLEDAMRNYDPESPENAEIEKMRAQQMRALSQDEIEERQRAQGRVTKTSNIDPINKASVRGSSALVKPIRARLKHQANIDRAGASVALHPLVVHLLNGGIVRKWSDGEAREDETDALCARWDGDSLQIFGVGNRTVSPPHLMCTIISKPELWEIVKDNTKDNALKERRLPASDCYARDFMKTKLITPRTDALEKENSVITEDHWRSFARKLECEINDLRERLDWQNQPNRMEPLRGGYEFYINEEWTCLRDAALDEDVGFHASLMKCRYDPDDERVRVRRIIDDDAILQELTDAREALARHNKGLLAESIKQQQEDFESE